MIELHHPRLGGGQGLGFDHLRQHPPAARTLVVQRPADHGGMDIVLLSHEHVRVGFVVVRQDDEILGIAQVVAIAIAGKAVDQPVKAVAGHFLGVRIPKLFHCLAIGKPVQINTHIIGHDGVPRCSAST